MIRMKHLIIDTSYLIYRSYFAYPLLTSNGQNTGAIYGFIKTVLSLIKEFEPNTLSFACDLPQKTWRHEVYSDYKSGRPEVDVQMREQIPIILEWCGLVTTNFFSAAGFEADDIIFTLCVDEIYDFQGSKDKKLNVSEDVIFEKNETIFLDNSLQEFLIFSSDKDLYQLLVQPKIEFISQHKGKIEKFNLNDFRQKYELEPRQWVDYKALVGDSSDNLKGVSGIGPKTAVKILQEICSLQLLFEVLMEPSEIIGRDHYSDLERNRAAIFVADPKNHKLIEKILSSKLVVEQTYRLATLQRVRGTKLKVEPFDLQNGLRLVEDYKLSSIVRNVQKLTGQMTKAQNIADDNALF